MFCLWRTLVFCFLKYFLLVNKPDYSFESTFAGSVLLITHCPTPSSVVKPLMIPQCVWVCVWVGVCVGVCVCVCVCVGVFESQSNVSNTKVMLKCVCVCVHACGKSSRTEFFLSNPQSNCCPLVLLETAHMQNTYIHTRTYIQTHTHTHTHTLHGHTLHGHTLHTYKKHRHTHTVFCA